MIRRRLLAVPLLLGLAACQAPPPRMAEAGTAPVRVVFFNQDSAALDEGGLAVVREAAAAARAAPRAPVAVLGFAGPVGSQGYNQALSDARARHVADELVAAGVEPARIAIRPRGPVPFEQMPTESRRVEIRIGG